MAWVDISSTRTAKNKPISQSLMDDIRTNLDWLYDGNTWVKRGNLATAEIETSGKTTGQGWDFDTAGAYGFVPQFKISNGGETYTVGIRVGANNTDYQTRFIVVAVSGAASVTGRIRYVTASRYFPCVFITFEKETNKMLECYYSTETYTKKVPCENFYPDKHICYCIQLAGNPAIDKVITDGGNLLDSKCWAVQLGLISGKLKIKPGAKPLLPENECPPLYADGVILADLEVCE